MRRIPLGAWIAPAAIAVTLLAGCKSNVAVTPVRTLLDDPARFDHQVVRVAGNVAQAVGILGYGAYRLDDGTGTILVVTKENGAPRQGAKVGVEGEFRSGYTFGAETGAVILEHQRMTP
jgi:hypothetical protein